MSLLFPAALDLAADADIGRRRTVNQDEAAALRDRRGRFALLLVCDGIGGLALGEVASRTVVHAVSAAMDGCVGDPRMCLEQAILDAHRAIQEASTWGQRMGTTVVAVLCTEDAIHVVHAGDSRAYLFRGGGLRPLTTDHSWVMEQVQAGRISLEEAERDPRRNVITRAVGTEEDLRLEATAQDPLHPGDVVFACSDGLHGPLRAPEMEAVLRAAGDAAGAVAGLIRRANERGGPDNIAVALARRAG